jgi:type II secretory ATPase GspE/PulE/Tfp pilus assembly ATPase PilB-like protein
VNKPIDSLGLLPAQIELLAATLDPKDRHGVILVGAPSGHGLTTTCYSLLGRHDAFTSNIKTLERQIELQLDGIDHTQFDSDNPAADYATNLQSILRRDPDIVLLADLKDPNTGKTAAGPGMNGPLLYIPAVLDSPSGAMG